MYEKAPDSLWSDRPSLRAGFASLGFLVVVTGVVWYFVPFWVKGFYESTYDAGFWPTDVDVLYKALLILQWVPKGLMILGILYNIFRLFVLWTIRYEVTPSRFLYHHGILVRKHDEIELHRIRDYRVINPILSRGLGLGMLYLITRDETYPELKVGPFLDARGVQSIIREGVEAHKKAVGFREFESH